VAALFGTTFATGALVVGKIYLIDQNLATTFTFTTFIGWDSVFGVIPWMLLAGLGLAIVAAGLTLQRYLKV
jgi:cell division transport system permease protein